MSCRYRLALRSICNSAAFKCQIQKLHNYDAEFLPVVLNSSDGEEHSRGQGEEESRDVAGGDGESGPLDNLAEVVGGRDVLEEASARDAVRLLTG